MQRNLLRFPHWSAALIATSFALSVGLHHSNLRAKETAENGNAGELQKVISEHCLDCHSGSQPEAMLDLSALSTDLSHFETFDNWVKVFDRIESGEMPPPEDAEPIPESAKTSFLSQTRAWLSETQLAAQRESGRVQARRLTNLQLEKTLQDLLHIDIPLATEMPEEPDTGTYKSLARLQSLSHFQLEQHLKIVDLALDEAFRRALTPADKFRRELTPTQLSRKGTRRRCREPELRNGQAAVWASRLIFYGRLPSTTAKESGWYRVRFEAQALKPPKEHGVWCTVRTGLCVSSAPLLGWVGSFEATDEPQEWEFDCWLPAGHMLEIRPGDTTLKMGRFRGGQVGYGEGEPQNLPGLAFNWLNIERIHVNGTDQDVRQRLFGDIEFDSSTQKLSLPAPKLQTQLGHRLIQQFADQAFRVPSQTDSLTSYFELFDSEFSSSADFTASLRAAYRAILCSARFMYFREYPGKLDDYAIASRLSYFLWNSLPDETLFDLAAKGKLTNPRVLQKQVSRMLATKRGGEFIRDFSAEWLELNQIDFTEPDRRNHPEFDIVVQNSMLAETHQFLQTLLDKNASVSTLVDAPFTFLNSRLARYYDIDNVHGDVLRRCNLPEDSHRGGLLSQGAILKVTANGTSTSPVLRGVWASERILGREIPPPPSNVPAIEPNIRGATTIREQLEKHRSNSECAVCHRKIDPPGYALENFDAAGKWRTHYTSANRKKRGARIDASYQTLEGNEFEDIDDFKSIHLNRATDLAKNFAKQLIAYGTGAEVTFADRQTVEQIVATSAEQKYGLRTILEEVVASDIFLQK